MSNVKPTYKYKSFDDFANGIFEYDSETDQVVYIRNHCFNGNGLRESICFSTLEKLWEAARELTVNNEEL